MERFQMEDSRGRRSESTFSLLGSAALKRAERRGANSKGANEMDSDEHKWIEEALELATVESALGIAPAPVTSEAKLTNIHAAFLITWGYINSKGE
jgi:hypothetical protein